MKSHWLLYAHCCGARGEDAARVLLSVLSIANRVARAVGISPLPRSWWFFNFGLVSEGPWLDMSPSSPSMRFLLIASPDLFLRPRSWAANGSLCQADQGYQHVQCRVLPPKMDFWKVAVAGQQGLNCIELGWVASCRCVAWSVPGGDRLTAQIEGSPHGTITNLGPGPDLQNEGQLKKILGRWTNTSYCSGSWGNIVERMKGWRVCGC